MTHDEWLAAKTAGERDRDEMLKRFAEVMSPWIEQAESYISSDRSAAELQALDPNWRYCSATANISQGITVVVDGKVQRWEEYQPGRYRLVHSRDVGPFDRRR